jgi:triosephosphate isomerase (TIM)
LIVFAERTPLVMGNWKMNGGVSESAQLARDIVEGAIALSQIDIALAPTALSLTRVAEVLGGTQVGLAAQNMHFEESGAFTGEISPVHLKEAGCRYVILGHSERRQLFDENDELVNLKLRSALNHGLQAVLCVGETLEDRDAGRTGDKVERQITLGLAGVRDEDLASVVIAYEPIWAIGTGRTASPEQAQEVHSAIRTLIGALHDRSTAAGLRILYGGSVKPSNIDALIACADIDGALVGGASLKAESFLSVCRSAAVVGAP